MSAIKNAYVCAVNGQPELFETELQAREYAIDVLNEWQKLGKGADLMLAIMSVTEWLQAKEHLAQLAV